jgi:ferredoxin
MLELEREVGAIREPCARSHTRKWSEFILFAEDCGKGWTSLQTSLESRLHFQHWETLRRALRYYRHLHQRPTLHRDLPGELHAPDQGRARLRDGRTAVCEPHGMYRLCGACIPVCPTTSIFKLEELPAELQEFVQKNAAYFNERCLTRTKAHRPPSRGELSFLECGSSPPLLRNDPAKRPVGVCAKSP